MLLKKAEAKVCKCSVSSLNTRLPPMCPNLRELLPLVLINKDKLASTFLPNLLAKSILMQIFSVYIERKIDKFISAHCGLSAPCF